MRRTKLRSSGFTIVELLIVVVIIAVLAAITLVTYTGIQDRARAASANSDLETLTKAVMLARINTGKTLGGITGSWCTYCNDTTGANTAATLDKIGAAAGMDLSKLKAGDPWGNKYKIDENQGEPTSTTSCTGSGSKDMIALGVDQSGVSTVWIPLC